LPRPSARSAIAGPARALIRNPSLVLTLQVVRQFIRIWGVLLLPRRERMAELDAVNIGRIVDVRDSELLGEAIRYVRADVPPRGEGAHLYPRGRHAQGIGIKQQAGLRRVHMPDLLVENGGAAAALTALDNARDVQILTRTEVGAICWIRVAAVSVEWEAAEAWP